MKFSLKGKRIHVTLGEREKQVLGGVLALAFVLGPILYPQYGEKIVAVVVALCGIFGINVEDKEVRE